MGTVPAHVEVLDPVDRWIHSGAALGVLGTLGSAPLLTFPAVAERWGIGIGFAASLHAGSALLAILAWAFHLVRVCLFWLEGRSPWGLVPRWTDLAALSAALAWVVGLRSEAPSTGRFTYRERFPYALSLLLLPLLAASGWVVAHPLQASAALSPEAVLTTAAVHGAVGLLALPLLLWHLYFAWLRPPALYWNGAWVTGKVNWERLSRMRPDWAADLERGAGPAASTAEEAPSVEALLAAGNLAAEEGRHGDAAAAYGAALDLYPGYAQALFNLGVVRYRQGDREGAAEALERFLEQDPFGATVPRARELLTRIRRGGGDR